MHYRNKIYMAFASEDFSSYRLLKVSRESGLTEFNDYDARDPYGARDTSRPEKIWGILRD